MRGQNNVQGVYSVLQQIFLGPKSDANGEKFEKIWDAELPEKRAKITGWIK